MRDLESDLESLSSRILKLEANNRRLKKAGIALLLVALGVSAMAQAPPKKAIEANEFVLKDASGNVRARLSMEGDNRPTLSFYKDKTTLTAALEGGDAPTLVLSRAGSTDQVQVSTNASFAGMAIYGKNVRAGLSVQKGVPALDLFDAEGNSQVSLSASSLKPGLTMNDHKNNSFLSLTASGFTMNDSAGAGRAALSTSDGKPSLTLSDKNGFSAVFGSADLVVPATGRKESSSAASVVLFAKDKKVLWSAP